MHLIHSNERIGKSIGKMIVDAPYVAQHRKAGQFIILRIDEEGERLPFTVADANTETGTITLIYHIAGTTTTRMSALKRGDFISDIAGPLGKATEIKKYGTAVCIGGGIGIAPVYPIARAMKEAGNRLITIMGVRSGDLLFYENELGEFSDELHVCTDDGTKGRKGFVTDVLAEIMERERVDVVVAIGPVPMMKAVSEVTKHPGILTFVSLNAIMVDGTGMCGGCRVTVGGETKFTCIDGPEFDAHQVDFDSLVQRLKTYQNEEKESMDSYQHHCRIEGAEDNDR